MSRPRSWSSYARSLWVSPIARPSWPRMYRTTPRPSLPTIAIAWRSCSPQSHRSDPKTSPVRHSECTRVSTASPSPISPSTSATCVRPSTALSYADARKSPHSVGIVASATRVTRTSRWRRYSIRSAMEMSLRSKLEATSTSSGRRAIVPSGFIDLADHAGGEQPGERGEVDRRLRVPRPAEHPTLLGSAAGRRARGAGSPGA